MLGACATHSDDPAQTAKVPPTDTAKPDTPKPDVAKPAVLATMSIASVQMIQDCPDPPPPAKPAAQPSGSATQAEPPAEISAGARARSPGDSEGNFAPMEQPCTQSMMQIAFTGHGPDPAPVVIKQVRLLSTKDIALGTLKTRGAAIFAEGRYKPWDETLAANADVKASYKLSLPDWSEVEKRAEGLSRYGAMYVLEVDVTVGGVLQTVRSPEFTREEPHVIVT